MAIKKIIVGTTTGSDVYCMIKRESNGFLFDNTDGLFRASSADPYLVFTEDSVIKGRYDVSESREEWSDGLYSAVAYSQTGGSPDPASDVILGIHYIYIKNDAEVLSEEKISSVNWENISSPVLLTSPAVGVTPTIRFNMIKDRTIDLSFDLHSDITSDTFYFAMKTDRKNEFYDVEPNLCTITDAANGLISCTITEDLTQNLEISKYYGELFRVTSAGKYQTIVLFDIDLLPCIIDTRDI